MKRVVIEKPVDVITNLDELDERQIVIGCFVGTDFIGWHKLSKIYIDLNNNYQWCSLLNTSTWVSCSEVFGFSSVQLAVKAFLTTNEYKNQVYVFDTFDQFIKEFPALVELKQS